MRASLLPVALVLALAATACGNDDDDPTVSTGTKQVVSVKAGDTTCQVDKTELKAGELELEVENVGKDVTEVYVYGKGSSGKFDKIVGEVENVAPSSEREFEVDVTGGEYEIACKPGQKGDGIRTEIDVEGEGGETEAAYDREVEVEATEFAFEGLADFKGKVGEKIEFKLENTGKTTHNFELFDPTGKEVAEIEDVAPGGEGEVVVELTTAGNYTFLCAIGNHKDKGMKGTFTVTPA
jgi:uncharacterized cupredoxin-like copper-binding protein